MWWDTRQHPVPNARNHQSHTYNFMRIEDAFAHRKVYPDLTK